MTKILAAARLILDGAIAVLEAATAVLVKARSLIADNTPETALLTALGALFQGVQSGALPVGAALITACTLLGTFVVTESAKDRAEIAATK